MSADLLARARSGDGEARMELARAASRAGKRAEAEHWIVEAAAAGQQTAIFQTGVWTLIGHRGPRDLAAGEAILKSAAEAGEAQAMAMMAALAVSALRPARDWSEARRYLLAAAEAHDPRAQLQIALMLPHDRKWQETRLALADRAAGKGYLTALYVAGCILLGQGGQEAQALARLTLAARGNEPNALKLLRSRRAPSVAETSSPVFELAPVNWARIAEAMQWPHERILPQAIARQSAPRIATLNRLFTAEECDYIVSRGVPFLTRLSPGAGGILRANAATAMGITESDALIQSLDELMCRAMGEPAGHGETPMLMLYSPAQHFGPVGDWLDPADPAARAEIEAHGQRIKTIAVTLNDGYEGGETVFPRIGWRFKGKRGDALTWRNLTEGEIEARTAHDCAMLRSADKFVLVKWMRDRPQPAIR